MGGGVQPTWARAGALMGCASSDSPWGSRRRPCTVGSGRQGAALPWDSSFPVGSCFHSPIHHNPSQDPWWRLQMALGHHPEEGASPTSGGRGMVKGRETQQVSGAGCLVVPGCGGFGWDWLPASALPRDKPLPSGFLVYDPSLSPAHMRVDARPLTHMHPLAWPCVGPVGESPPSRGPDPGWVTPSSV